MDENWGYPIYGNTYMVNGMMIQGKSEIFWGVGASNSNISTVYGRYIDILPMVYKATYDSGAPPCRDGRRMGIFMGLDEM